MSVRIHAIAKEIKKTSKEVLEILAKRGYDLKSASSTIDNITAQSLIEEFTKEDSEPKENPKEAQESNKEEELTEKATNIPIVKSKEDLEREKREREEVDEDSQSTDEASEEDINPSGDSVSSVVGNAPNLPPPPVGKKASAPPPPISSEKVASSNVGKSCII